MAVAGRTAVKRHPERGVYDRTTIETILDQALICHLGFEVDGQPYVIPTIHARIGDRVYLHGSPASRMVRTMVEGAPVCLTATILDALVLARSAVHHSMNYRSVVVLGRARHVTDPEEKLAALAAVVEHVVPGRWGEVRPPNEKEMKATSILAISLGEASAKVRRGPPIEDPADESSPVWAGELPIRMATGTPIPDPLVPSGTAIPEHVRAYRRPAPTQRATLLVIDVQRAFDDPSWGPRNNPQAESNVAALLEAWRSARAPILHVRHRSRSAEGLFRPGTPAVEFKQEATPLPGEPVVEKSVNSAFIGTDLEARLREQGNGSLVLVGLTTDHCVSTTARMAGNLGFDTVVVSDATATFDRMDPWGEIMSAETIHRSSLASLHGEFAEVVDTEAAIVRLLSVSDSEWEVGPEKAE